MQRRQWLTVVATSIVAPRLRAQEATRNTTGAPMNQEAYRPVRLARKTNVRATLTDAERDALEHHLHCQCGCGLDVYTCRTTDFSCSVSPAMHADVMGLVAGGYTAQEIIAAFRRVYGDGVLMEPAKEGFNWLAYFLPFGALAGGGVLVFTLLRRWSRPPAEPGVTASAPVDATPDELERLRAAMRDDA